MIPESCVGNREAAGEALTGAPAGQPLSREINCPGCRRYSDKRKATWCMALSQAMHRSCAVADPEHAGKLLAQELGGLISTRGICRVRRGRETVRPLFDAGEKSDTLVVQGKLPNKGKPAEVVEGRGVATGNADGKPACRTQSRIRASM